MTEQESTIKTMLSGPLSRRDVLKGGLVASSAAFLAACGAATTSSAPAPESAAPASAAPGQRRTGQRRTDGGARQLRRRHPEQQHRRLLDPGIRDRPRCLEGRDRRQRHVHQHPVRREAGQVRELHRHAGRLVGPALHVRHLHAAVRDAAPAPARRQLHRRPERLHPERPARLHDAESTRSCAACRSTSARGCGPGTRSCGTRSARTATTRPTRTRASSPLTPKFVEAGIIPCAQPWLGAGGTFAKLYWTHIYNSTGHPMFSEDRTQVMFDGPEGLSAFQTIEAGPQEWLVGRPIPEHHQRARSVRRVRQGQHGGRHEQRVGDRAAGGRAAGAGQARTFASSRASSPARPARPQGADGLGVNKWTQQPEATWSFFNRLYTPDIALADQPARAGALSTDAHVGAQQSGGHRPSRCSCRRTRRRHRASPTSGPRRMTTTPIFDDVVNKLIKGEYSAQQAHDAAVTAAQDLIITYLST